jgi:hypothetical protein
MGFPQILPHFVGTKPSKAMCPRIGVENLKSNPRCTQRQDPDGSYLHLAAKEGEKCPD